MTYFLETIDIPEKAYCLGFFCYINETHSKFAQNTYELPNINTTDDKEILNLLGKVADVIYDEKTDITAMTVDDVKTLEFIKTNVNKFDEWTDKQKKEFIRGIYEYNYLLNDENADITIKRISSLEVVIDKIASYMNIPYIYRKSLDGGPDEFLIKYGCSSVDFLGSIYSRIYNNFSFRYANFNANLPRCCVVAVNEKAVIPYKENWSDVGYDLTIISKSKDFNKTTALYDTGIKINVDFGYYAEIVPRSSLSKSGYIMANSIGIIDNSYRGNLMIALTKIDDEVPELTLPFRCCQLIMRKQVFSTLDVIDYIDETKRGEGGFGSTN
jgi:dUTP pyrophosphatase